MGPPGPHALSVFLVFLLYWTLIYDGGTPRAITPFTHGYNFAAMAVDQLLTNQPVRPWHFVYFIGSCFISSGPPSSS